MSDQYQPTSYYDWPNREHGLFLQDGTYKYVQYDYYGGDELYNQNTIFRHSQYVTFDNTHVRFLNKTDLHLYDTSGIRIFDSGTLTMHTSASPSARTFVVDEIGRIGIGMDHTGPHSMSSEAPSFDLDVKGQVGIEDYIYHNDNTDTYMLFGSDLSAHNINQDGSSNTIYPDDQDEINFRVGGIDMLQMQTRDLSATTTITGPATDGIVTIPIAVANTTNPVTLGTVLKLNTTQYGTIQYKGTHDAGLANAQFDGANSCFIYVSNTTAGQASWQSFFADIASRWNSGIPQNNTNAIASCQHNSDGTAELLTFQPTGNYGGSEGTLAIVLTPSIQDGTADASADGDANITQITDGTTTTTIMISQPHVTVNKYQSDVDFIVRTETNTGAIVVSGDGTEIVLNEDGNDDTDLRYESSVHDEMLYIDTSENEITINGASDDDTRLLTIQGNGDDAVSGHDLLSVYPTEIVVNEDANLLNLRVEGQADPQQDTTDTGTDGNVQTHLSHDPTHALFVDASNSRVGLGTDTPMTTLHVAGSAHIEGDLWIKGVTNQIDTLVYVTSAMNIHNIGTGPTLQATQSGNQPVAIFWDMDHTDTLQPSLYLADKTMAGFGIVPEAPMHLSDTVQNYSEADTQYITSKIDHNYMHGGLGIDSTTGDKQSHVRFLSAGDTRFQLRHPLHLPDAREKNTLRVHSYGYGGDVMTWSASGNVGIGFAHIPETRLHIKENFNNFSIEGPISRQDLNTLPVKISDNDLTNTKHTVNAGINMGFRTEESSAIVSYDDGNNAFQGLGFITGSYLDAQSDWLRTNMVIDGLGNVGVGTTRPEETGIGYNYSTTGNITMTLSGRESRNARHTIAGNNTALNLIETNGDSGLRWMQILSQDESVKFIALNDNGSWRDRNPLTGDPYSQTIHPILTLKNESGYVGVNSSASHQLHVHTSAYDNNGLGVYISRDFPAVPDDGTRNQKVMEVRGGYHLEVAEAARDQGYRVALDASMYIQDTDFKGQIDRVYGVWARAGTYKHSTDTTRQPTGTIDNSYSIYVDALSGEGTTINNSYGVYQNGYGGQYDHKNYFENPIGINTTNPRRLLTIAGTGAYSNNTAPAIRLDNTTTNRFGIISFSDDQYMNLWASDQAQAGGFKFFTGGGAGEEKVRISSEGHIGVDTGADPVTTMYLSASDALRIPVGNVTERPDQVDFGFEVDDVLGDGTGGTVDAHPMLGMIRYNKSLSTFEGFGPGYTWGSLGGVIDIDRDTYWTAVNDIDGDQYPGDPDHLRAYVGHNPTPVNAPGSLEDPEYGANTSSTMVMDMLHDRVNIERPTHVKGTKATAHSGKFDTKEYAFNITGAARMTGENEVESGTGVNVNNSEMRMMYAYGSSYVFEHQFNTPSYQPGSVPTQTIHLAFRQSGYGFKYKLTMLTDRNGHWRNWGYVTDEAYLYWESDQDFTTDHHGETHNIGNMSISTRDSYLTNHFTQDGGSTVDDVWYGMNKATGSTTDPVHNYIIRYGVDFSGNIASGSTGTGQILCKLEVTGVMNNLSMAHPHIFIV